MGLELAQLARAKGMRSRSQREEAACLPRGARVRAPRGGWAVEQPKTVVRDVQTLGHALGEPGDREGCPRRAGQPVVMAPWPAQRREEVGGMRNGVGWLAKERTRSIGMAPKGRGNNICN